MKREKIVFPIVSYIFYRNAPQINKICIHLWKTKKLSFSISSCIYTGWNFKNCCLKDLLFVYM